VKSGPAPAFNICLHVLPVVPSGVSNGFSQCSDCKIELVESSKEAKSAAVQLWKSTRQRTLDLILDSLCAHEIPTHSKEVANDVGLQVRFLGSRRPKFELHYEVWVLRSDIARARNAMRLLSDSRFLRSIRKRPGSPDRF